MLSDCCGNHTMSICKPCFDNSEHRYHDFQCMVSSGASCDCGDEEGWLAHPYCSSHKGIDSHSLDDLPNVFGEDFESIVNIELPLLFECIKNDLLISEKCGDPNNDQNCVILYNNEVHTFADVILNIIFIINFSK